MDLKENVAAAKAEGLSYGEYVMKHSPPVTVVIPQDKSRPQVTQSEEQPSEPEKSGRTEKICPICGKFFRVGPSQNRKKYCSDACRNKAANTGRTKPEPETKTDTLCPSNSEHDPVNHPSHYTQGGVECIEAIEAACTGLEGFEGYCIGNAIKYEWRWKRKNGVEDIDKAIWYLKRLRDYLTKEAEA